MPDTALRDPPSPGEGTGGVLVLAAHPDWRHSRVNRRLRDAALGLPGLQLRDLYELYPDFDIDVPAEQQAAAQARLIVMLFPVQWYAMPPLLKLWLDEVLAYNWAYGPRGRALQGKDLWLVASTGGPEASYHPQGYNRYFFDAFTPPWEQTAALCGMRFLPPLVLHAARRIASTELQAHATVFVERLATHPAWPELDELASCPACEVPATDRPAD